MIKIAVIVGLGGMLGSAARYLTGMYVSRFFPGNLPVGTFTVNVLGCLLVGLLYGVSLKEGNADAAWRFFLITGFCGGFTTFSAFSLENIRLLQQGNFPAFALYSIASVLLGLLAVYVGLSLVRS